MPDKLNYFLIIFKIHEKKKVRQKLLIAKSCVKIFLELLPNGRELNKFANNMQLHFFFSP